MSQLRRAAAHAASSARAFYMIASRRTLGAGTTQSYTRPHQRPFTAQCLLPVKTPKGHLFRIQTLAIETSCDDTSVAVLSISRNDPTSGLRTHVLFHETLTANTTPYGGIHPVVALESHQTRLAPLIAHAIEHLDPTLDGHGMQERKPDFVSVTRGPGMRANLSVGLHTAKGLALAWKVPLVGVHHMVAHALTARLCSVLPPSSAPQLRSRSAEITAREIAGREWRPQDVKPAFPFLSLLASGGHTLLLDSVSPTHHRVLAETQDIALGDFLDKVARLLLTPAELQAPFGKALEDFAFPSAGEEGYGYRPPKTRGEELRHQTTRCGWSVDPPLAESKSGLKSSRRMVYSFAGLLSSIQRFTESKIAAHNPALGNPEALADILTYTERRELAREVQRIAFEHLASRILLHLSNHAKAKADANPIRHNYDEEGTTTIPPLPWPPEPLPEIRTIVLSGGVASNNYLRHILRALLDIRGHENVELDFPPPELCTDNALMIAWAGMEMFEAGFTDGLGIEPLRKWGMEDLASSRATPPPARAYLSSRPTEELATTDAEQEIIIDLRDG